MSLEQKKKKLELARVQLAAQELELKVEQYLEDIARLQSHIEVQKQTEEKLKKDLEKF